MSSIRLQIKDSIMHYLCDDWNNHNSGKAHKENIGLYDREDSKPIWCNIDLEMIMEKVVKGIYATDFDTYEKQIREEALDDFLDRVSESIIWDILAEIMKRNIGASEGADKVIEHLQMCAEQLKAGVNND